MKRKIAFIIFIVLCLGVCVLPFVGMTVAPTTEPIGNERLSDFPLIKTEEGAFNSKFLSELGDWFSTHYAFRPEIISLDAKIQSKLFGVSNLDSVIVGKNDWLYYSSTLDNYLGRNLMSDRAVFSTVNNLEITQEYLTANGIDFLFTVAPNKNTVYPENMPWYYSIRERNYSDVDAFADALEDSTLNYCDLFDVINVLDEVVYHQQDSHWNNKGALYAYNAIMDSLGKDHNDYASAKAVREKNFYGDLGKMLYPASQEPEYNYNYDIQWDYSYVTPTESVEEAIIITENPSAEGRLYMYRDSFGNALLPFVANAYNSAYFTKTFPVNLALDTGVQKSDTVVFEIAERNLRWFAENPPVIPSAQVVIPSAEKLELTTENLKAEISNVNMQYVAVTGTVPEILCADDSEFIVVADGNGYEAFTTVTEDSDYGFMAYIPLEELSSESVSISVIVESQDSCAVTESVNTEILQAEI